MARDKPVGFLPKLSDISSSQPQDSQPQGDCSASARQSRVRTGTALHYDTSPAARS